MLLWDYARGRWQTFLGRLIWAAGLAYWPGMRLPMLVWAYRPVPVEQTRMVGCRAVVCSAMPRRLPSSFLARSFLAYSFLARSFWPAGVLAVIVNGIAAFLHHSRQK